MSMYFYYNNVQIQMDNEFECIKIKDGLYLGTLPTVQDYEFLHINKFAYIVNCSAEIPNYYDNHQIKYLKFKLIKDKSHRLWDETLKKLRKLERFVEEAEDLSLCCMIFSAAGNNRSLVMLCAFLMSKYRWNLDKTLAYVRSKNIFIGLSQAYIIQLQELQGMLNQQQSKAKLSASWKCEYNSQQEELISKTFINSQEIVVQSAFKKQRKEKRIAWQDKLDKEKKKEIKESKIKQAIGQQFKKTKSHHKLTDDPSNHNHNSLSTKLLKNNNIDSPLKRGQGGEGVKLQAQGRQEKMQLKKKEKGSCCSVSKVETQVKLKKMSNYGELMQAKEVQADDPLQAKYLTEKQILKLIKKNLKIKKEPHEERTSNVNNNTLEQREEQKNVYKLTINNFISPNINIINAPPQPKHPTNIKEYSKDKNARTIAEKEMASKGCEGNKAKKASKANKSFKRNTQNSPLMREKKMQKAISVQMKHH